MKKPILFIFLIVNLFAAANSQLSIASVRYVSHSGSNTPPYLTWETAADSIMSAINISSFGDTIYVANGVFEEVVDMIAGLTLIGEGSDSCIIDTRAQPFYAGFYSVQLLDSCTFSNFGIITFDNQHGTSILVTGGNNSVVDYCKTQQAAEGITINGPFQNKPLVYKNIVINTTYGISNYFSQAIIKENIVFASIGNGIGGGLNSRATFLNNTVICLSCSEGYSGTNSILKNNLFYGNGDYGMFSYGDSIQNNVIFGVDGGWDDGIFGADLDIRNNHIENTNRAIRYDVGGGSYITVKYNNLWNNQINYQNFTADTTNIISDPMFMDSDSLDFHLQAYSPLIDRGDPNILDKDSSRSDIGLYGGPFGESYKYLDLPPHTPVNFTAILDTNDILLTWNKNTEADFNHYNLYRDTTQGFTIDSTKLVASIEDTFYLHIIPPGMNNLYFKVTAEDNQGNESETSEEIHIVLTGTIKNEKLTINNYQLYQNYPNPFNPSTRIGYRLKERGYVKLYVYDVKGELVETLVNKYQEAGFYEETFNSSESGNSEFGIRKLASGIYIYQLMIKNENNIPIFSDIKKMLLLK